MILKYQGSFDRNPPAGFDGQFVWDFLKPAWHREGAATQIDLMDIDAVCNRHGHFMKFETKTPGQAQSPGQLRTLDDLVRTMPENRCVVVFCAKTAEDIDGWWTWCLRGCDVKVDRYEGNADALRDWCTKWFQWASTQQTSWRVTSDELQKRFVLKPPNPDYDGQPCFVCGAPDAPYSYDNGWTWYCREHDLERDANLARLAEAYARDAASPAGVCKACGGMGCPHCQPKQFGIGGNV